MTRRGIITSISIAILTLALASTPALAAYRDLIGYPELETALGSSVPTGTGVLVTHIEASFFNGSFDAYLPDPGLSEFSGKSFTDGSSSDPDYSDHAKQVGMNFYGNDISIADDIDDITVFEAVDWMNSGFLRKGTTPAPYTSTSRIANHSWIYDSGSSSSKINTLSRLDFVVETDDFIQVLGINNESAQVSLLADSYNAITVGLSNAIHTTGTTSLNSIYVSGRNMPDLVGPGDSPTNSSLRTSWSAPMVAAAAALLVETGHTNTGLSNGSYSSPRTAATIYHAETSEVIKAALMAGADRNIDNYRGADITDYTIDTDNGLDNRFGAGQVNIFNSYNIINGSEHDSSEDGDATDISQYGFDYDPAFGGSSGSNSTASYFFDAAAGQNLLVSSLVWNLDIAGGAVTFDESATLRDLDLLLYDVTSGSTLLASSDSTIDNTENLYQQLTVGHSYKLEVSPKTGQGDFLWDYGLAWQLASTSLPGDVNDDGWISGIDLSIIITFWGQTGLGRSFGDLDGDGTVDGNDYSEVLSYWGTGLIPLEPPEPGETSSTVPEPATLWLMILAGAILAKRNKK